MSDNNASAINHPSTSSNLIDRVKGPGLLYVRSRVAPSAKDILSEATFLRWYEKHAEEVVAKSGIHSLFRFNATSRTDASDASKPFLTCPVMDDIGFLLSEDFKSISPKSAILPDTGNVYDLVEFDINYLALRQNSVSKRGYSESAKSIVTVEIQPPMRLEADKLNAFLGKQVKTLDEESGYMRSLIFESCFSFASARDKNLEGGRMKKQHELPSWVIIHTFSGVVSNDVVKRIELDLHKMDESVGNMQGEVKVWSLQNSFGEEKLFA